MNVKKAIAAALMVGTLTTAGAAFAMPHDGPRFHDTRHDDSHALRWEHHRQMEHERRMEHRRAVRAIRHEQAVRRHIAHEIMKNPMRGRW